MNTKTLERYKEIRTELGLQIFSDLKQEHEVMDQDVFNELLEKGTDFVSMLKLYQESLKKNNKLPLSVFSEDIQNINIICEYIREYVESFVNEPEEEQDICFKI